jgi:hypothetical protein
MSLAGTVGAGDRVGLVRLRLRRTCIILVVGSVADNRRRRPSRRWLQFGCPHCDPRHLTSVSLGRPVSTRMRERELPSSHAAHSQGRLLVSPESPVKFRAARLRDPSADAPTRSRRTQCCPCRREAPQRSASYEEAWRNAVGVCDTRATTEGHSSKEISSQQV